MLNKIIVLGANGMLGKDLLQHLKAKDIITPSHLECDLKNWSSIDQFFNQVKDIDIVINCAAYTKVDLCETEETEAIQINGEGPYRLAQWCKYINAKLLHVSTDYVFDGTQEIYTIKNTPNPQSVYGKSKLIGEMFIQTDLSQYFIVRTSWLYGKHGKNFVNTILDLAKKENPIKIVNDQIGCPTNTQDLSQAICSLIETENYGIHHAAGTGACTWYELAKKILELSNINKEIFPISTEESFKLFPNIKAKRPRCSILKNTLPMRPWEISLKEYLEK